MLGMTIAVIVYLAALSYLGFRGYRTTHNSTDYMIGGRKIHPYVMAMSYGATFISTSAIVGFGGAAPVFGMGLLWLTFLNIFFGIFIAFVLFGGRTRHMGLRLDAHTFPELLGRRFQSRFIQGSVGILIFVFMPLYASAVLMGAAKYLAQQFEAFNMSYEVALFTLAVLIAAYVVMGGLKGVMYTDALQGSLMLAGMIILLIYTYTAMGGMSNAHRALSAVSGSVPPPLIAAGHQGWTRMPSFGSPLWWQLVSTIVLGVGIGVLAQPQLAVRYMTVKSGRELNRAVPIGGVFILMMTGVAFVVGSLSNVLFIERLGLPAIAAAAGDVERIIPMYLQQAMPAWFGTLFMLTLLAAAMSTLSSQFHVMGTSIGRDVVEQSIRRGRRESVLVTRLGVVVGIVVSVSLGYWLEKTLGGTGTEIVARGTAIFFGLCASAFLPMYIGGLWSRRITRAGAIAGMLSGALASIFWMLFFERRAAAAFGLCQRIFGRSSLGMRLMENAEGVLTEVPIATGHILWPFVDPLLIGLPLAVVVTVLVSLFTLGFDDKHLDHCMRRN